MEMAWLKSGSTVMVFGPRNNYVGRVVQLIGNRLIELENASWVSQSGQYLSTFVSTGKAPSMEIEPVGHGIFSFDDVIEWPHKLFTQRV